MYPIQLTQPMADELKSIGFQSIQNPEDVKQALENAEGTTLLVVNSVCGCAAANARPGVRTLDECFTQNMIFENN